MSVVGREGPMREINDRIYETLVSMGTEDGDFVCECGDEDCFGTVQITLREYRAMRETPTSFSLRAATHGGPAQLRSSQAL